MVIIRLSNGEKYQMNSSLEEFNSEYLDERGFFKVGYINIKLEDMKSEPTIFIFTNQIVAVEEETQ